MSGTVKPPEAPDWFAIYNTLHGQLTLQLEQIKKDIIDRIDTTARIAETAVAELNRRTLELEDRVQKHRVELAQLPLQQQVMQYRTLTAIGASFLSTAIAAGGLLYSILHHV